MRTVAYREYQSTSKLMDFYTALKYKFIELPGIFNS